MLEWFIILVVAFFYSGQTLLDSDAGQLQQTGEHNESVTLPLLAEIGLTRYGEIPLWNPYMLTGFPHVGDFINHFWNPVATLPVLIWGGIVGMRISVFLSLAMAGIGQWLFAHLLGVRGVFRLWAGLLFMVSGGLALLWRLGWYELLLGAVWFPWCFATTWWAMQRRELRSLALAAICVALVVSAGGGYYPVYLLVSLGVLVGMALLWAPAAERWSRLRRAIVIVVLSAGLLAVSLLPLVDGYRYTARDTLPDEQQRLSQPISYALVNYIVSDPEWFAADVLGKGSGWSWFYIGTLPFIAILFIPLAYSKMRWHRPALVTLAVLAIALLAWQANRYAPVSFIYDRVPFLYTFRFPNRLLVIAASPLIVLAGMGLQFSRLLVSRWGRNWRLSFSRRNGPAKPRELPVRWLLYGVLLLIMAFSLANVYRVNQGFAFARQRLNRTAYGTLRWLKEHDPGLYYTSLGGDRIFWDWMPAAYDLEMPVINFRYNRRLKSMDAQLQPESPFAASAKYLVTAPDQPGPADARFLEQFGGVALWHLPDALPFAFSARAGLLQSPGLINADVSPLAARLAGPNRVVVRGEPTAEGDHLVVLVSDYPGWRLYVDGQSAPLRPVNGYLGALLRPGEHTYTFVFRPIEHVLGLAISLLTLAVVFGLLLAKRPFWLYRLLAPSPRP